MRIGVIGCGTIASAVVRGIADDGHQITVSERSEKHAKALKKAHANVAIADNQAVVDASDILFLGLMAEAAPDVLGKLKFREDQRVITFMAGLTLEEAHALVSPARAVAIMMPFPRIADGGSPIMMLGDVDLVQALFGNRNEVFPLQNNDEMAAYLCAQAVLSPVTQMVSDAADWLGEWVSDRSQGEIFLRTLVASSLSNKECGALIEALNAPGGFNQRLRLHMESQGISKALKAGLDNMR